MPDFKVVYREFLLTVKGDIEEQMNARGINATRHAIQRLRVVANQFLEAQLRGVFYMEFLQTGKGIQPKGVNKSFADNILEWMQAKGIQPKRDGQAVAPTRANMIRSAGAIARGIVARGTKYKRGAQGLDFKTPIKENMPKLLKEMGTTMAIDFSNGLKLKRR